MSQETWSALQKLTTAPAKYEPAEKYASHEYVYLPLDDRLALRVREIHEANNLPTDNSPLAQLPDVFLYFARLTDSKGRRLTALRRATQFKGVLNSRLL